jgi:hypothetical protein
MSPERFVKGSLRTVQLSSGGEGGLYCSFFRNSLIFCHFIRKTRNFCCLRASLSSLFRLSRALQSPQWTLQVPKKSNISNKLGPPFLRLL